MTTPLKPKEVDLNIFTGELTYLPMPNFSYEEIPVNCCVKVFEYQQMILFEDIIIDGNLILDGSLVILE